MGPNPRVSWRARGTQALRGPSHTRALLRAGRAGAGTGERGEKLPGRPGRRAAGGFIVSFRPPPPAPRPGVTGKPPEPPGGWLFIARAARASRSPAWLTGPLTRLAAGPSPRGCTPGAGDNGLLCVQLPSPLGTGGRGAGGRSPTTPPSRPRPPKRNRPLLPLAGPRRLLLFSFLFLKNFISQFSLPQPPLPPPPLPLLGPQHDERVGFSRPGATTLCVPGSGTRPRRAQRGTR